MKIPWLKKQKSFKMKKNPHLYKTQPAAGKNSTQELFSNTFPP